MFRISRPALFLAPLCSLTGASAALAVDPPGAKPQTVKQQAESIATDPLEDVNARKKEIPAALERILDAPYARTGAGNCREIVAAVTELDGALGPDVDASPAEKKDAEARAAVAVTKGVVGSFIPGRGLIREISGANKAEARYNQALYAGIARRSFLKGLGAAKGCKPPGAPLASR